MSTLEKSSDTNVPVANNTAPNTESASPSLDVNNVQTSSTGGTTINTNNQSQQDKSTSGGATQTKNPSTKSKSAQAASSYNASDYSLRSNALNSNNNRQKVALVGRTGAGARALSPDLAHTASSLDTVTSVVVFEATPDLSESGQSILVDIGDIRAAASVVFYMGSPSRTFALSAKFISRTAAEAKQNYTYISILKAWREPTLVEGQQYNAEPETLRLFAYGNVLKGIPVMVESISVEYSSETDFIQTTDASGETIWVPIIQNVSLGLKEVRSIDDLNTFDYPKFKKGILEGW